MEAAKRKRRLARRNFNTLYDSLETLILEEPLNKDLIEVKFRLLAEASRILFEEDAQVLNLMLNAVMTEEEENLEYDEMNRYKEKSEVMQLKKEKLLPIVSSNSSETPCSGNSDGTGICRNFKLPTIQMKKFKGNLDKWLGFWAQFKKIHEDETLHVSDKFHYLMQSLELGTEPHDIAQGYPQSEENYPKLVEALTKRYGDEDKQLQVHLRKLLSFVTSNVRSCEKISVEKLFHKLTAHLGALKSLKLEKADPDSWLYPLVESSLPENILYNWERSLLSTHDGSLDDPPRTRLQLLMSFLEREVDIRQKIQISKSFVEEPVKSFKVASDKRKPVATLSSCNSSEVRNLKCGRCQGSHASVMCNEGISTRYEPPQKRSTSRHTDSTDTYKLWIKKEDC